MFFGEFACVFISDNNLSPKPGNKVVPPERTIWLKSILLRSRSVRIIELTSMSWIPVRVRVSEGKESEGE